jgi:serine/threonine protein kinase
MKANTRDDLTIFNAALEITAPLERAAYIDRACGDDAALRQKIVSLLVAYENAGDTFDHFGRGGTTKTQAESADPERVGSKIGRYKLLQKIGEGGCGAVYMAEQEEPVRRRVALKIIKLGMDTKSVIARFEAERQALAMMDHPNIAKVLEAGATETGRPFFVMELVHGTKITDYCDRNQLSTAERLDLFQHVCRAMQHAHQKGVIHRDLKPSNILVAVNDGVPVPKVIDFGIAKATEGKLTDKSVSTELHQFIGTPAYMSPEQAELASVDVDTRSDIYSLGVLLYELLTGKTPFETQELVAAGLDEMRRIIREGEPLRPSTRLSALTNAELTEVAKHRGAEPLRLASLVLGELDWIVMKCLEKDRTRRYETANGLAQDIERYSNNEPVSAAAPGTTYRLRKFIRRHRSGLATAAALLLLLVAGLVASSWQAVRASRAEQRARKEASKSQQVAQLLKDMLSGVGPSVAQGRDTTMLREILDKTAERMGKNLTNEPEVEIELRTTLAQTYHELGLASQMEKMARGTLDLARSRLGEENLSVADALGQLGDALMHLGHLDQAEKLTRDALAIRLKLLGNERPAVASALNHLAAVLRGQARFSEAETIQRDALV